LLGFGLMALVGAAAAALALREDRLPQPEDFPAVRPDGYTGVWRRWHSPGKMAAESNWFKGQYHGVSTVWYASGRQKRVERVFRYGVAHGLTRHWYPDGKLREKCHYVNGNLHGVSAEWRRDGKKRHEMTYEDDIPVGQETWWDEKGAVTAQGDWKDGKRWSGTFMVNEPGEREPVLREYKEGKPLGADEKRAKE
jgi:hypothetical protein